MADTRERGKAVTVTADEYNALLVRAVKLEDERDALREALERVVDNAESWHGDNEAKARALAVIAQTCRAALTGST